MIRTAVALAQKGMAVFPLIRQWWRQEPQFNLAIATVSGIFVVDIDGLDAEVELRRLEAEYGGFPSTVEVLTARGRHVYFRSPEILVRSSASKIAPGIDVRGDGGYVLAPPSIHPSGRRYEWSVDCATALAEAPVWLIDKISVPAKGVAPPLPPVAWRELVAGGAAEGTRDCTITKLAGHLLRHRIDPFVALELLQSWNATRCVPPLLAADIERIVASVAGRELRRRADA